MPLSYSDFGHIVLEVIFLAGWFELSLPTSCYLSLSVSESGLCCSSCNAVDVSQEEGASILVGVGCCRCVGRRRKGQGNHNINNNPLRFLLSQSLDSLRAGKFDRCH